MLQGCRKCRREGDKLMLKGDKCLGAACTFVKRPYAPGQHGQSFKGKMSEYGKQLREKQKARKIYGISESQFRKYVELADKLPGNKTENLMQLLESRVDNIVYRLGFATSRAMARQMVSHGRMTLNGKRITIPSIRVKAGDIITPKVADKFKELTLNSSILWLDSDSKKMTGTVKHLPTREEIDTPVNESLIIEFYSR